MSATPRKVALVTGSATGAGRAIAVRFAKLGLAVAVNYSRSEKEAEETFAEVKGHGGPAILCKANVADDATVRSMNGTSLSHFALGHVRWGRRRMAVATFRAAFARRARLTPTRP